MSKSDAFDVNALPIKVARIRLRFDAPVWTNASDPKV